MCILDKILHFIRNRPFFLHIYSYIDRTIENAALRLLKEFYAKNKLYLRLTNNTYIYITYI